MLKNYYDILGVEKTATDEEIKEAYRMLAKKYHPDTNPDPDAHQKFVDINEAHKVLSNESARDLYNVELTEEINQNAPIKAPTSIEIIRQKRAGRYQRGHYQRRDFGKKKNYSHFDHEQVQNRQALRRGAQVAFGYFSIVSKIVSAFAFVLTLGLIVDYIFASKQEPEMVLYKTERTWSFAEPGLVRFQTPNYRFAVARGYGKYLFQGQSVEVVATPIGKFVTKVYLYSWKVGKTLEVRPMNSVYGGTFIVIVLLLFFSAFAFRPGNNAELLTYIGFVNIFLLYFVISGLMEM